MSLWDGVPCDRPLSPMMHALVLADDLDHWLDSAVAVPHVLFSLMSPLLVVFDLSRYSVFVFQFNQKQQERKIKRIFFIDFWGRRSTFDGRCRHVLSCVCSISLFSLFVLFRFFFFLQFVWLVASSFIHSFIEWLRVSNSKLFRKGIDVQFAFWCRLIASGTCIYFLAFLSPHIWNKHIGCTKCVLWFFVVVVIYYAFSMPSNFYTQIHTIARTSQWEIA